ncbi:MAG: hypothetical protein GY838_03350 [bacterium]|nr:hypothetical protein [bacterium]
MADYEIKILPTHNEVILKSRIDLVTVTAILEELAETEDFPHRDAIWVFGNEVDPPAFDDFDAITEVVERYLASARVGKRVGVVTGAGTMSSIIKLWRASATSLSMKLEVFTGYDNARLWLT